MYTCIFVALLDKKKEKILFIGDSISKNVRIDTLEEATQSEIITVRAYSSVYDNEENSAKQAAKIPEANFHDVVQAELKKEEYKTLLLQSGSVDISNLKTRENVSQYSEYFKQESIMSAKNLFQSAVNGLAQSPNLEKVVIMKQTPRYDPANTDPMAIKPVLSQLYNNTLTEEWMNSQYKDKIIIGSHNIDCTGAVREARYRETRTQRFDGVHLYGSSGMKAYTMSVLNILRDAQLTSPEYEYHQSCPQTTHQQTQRSNRQQSSYRHTQNRFTLPTANRFQGLAGIQGNY